MNKILINPDTYALEDAGHVVTEFAFDLDSVLSECRYIPVQVAAILGVSLSEVIEGSKVDGVQHFQYRVDGVSNNTMYAAVNQVVHDYSYTAPTTLYMREVMLYLHDLTGLPITICTARKRTNADVTKAWLDLHLEGIPYQCYISCGREKYKILVDAGVRFFVDDRYKTIDNLWGHILGPILYRRPWNQGRKREASCFQIRDLRDMIPLFNIENRLPPATWPGYIPYPDTV
jgi:hypothetical protein